MGTRHGIGTAEERHYATRTVSLGSNCNLYMNRKVIEPLFGVNDSDIGWLVGWLVD